MKAIYCNTCEAIYFEFRQSRVDNICTNPDLLIYDDSFVDISYVCLQCRESNSTVLLDLMVENDSEEHKQLQKIVQDIKIRRYRHTTIKGIYVENLKANELLFIHKIFKGLDK